MASLPHGEEAGDGQDIRLVVDTIPTLAWSARPDGSAEFFNERTTAKEKPAKFAVEAAEAAIHFVRLYRIQSFPECFENSWQVVWMNSNLPSRAQSLLCR
jgi:hypothetical protein